VTLRSGLVVLEPAGFRTLRNFATAIDFDDLPDTATSYEEDGFRLSGSIRRSDAISPSAAHALPADGDAFVLEPVSGGSLALYSVDLAAPAPGLHPVTFTATTLNGGVLEQTFTVSGEAGFQTFEFLPWFAALTSVSWTPGATTVDNIVVTEVVAGGAPAPPVPPIGDPTLTSAVDITFRPPGDARRGRRRGPPEGGSRAGRAPRRRRRRQARRRPARRRDLRGRRRRLRDRLSRHDELEGRVPIDWAGRYAADAGRNGGASAVRRTNPGLVRFVIEYADDDEAAWTDGVVSLAASLGALGDPLGLQPGGGAGRKGER
jgi:hypothetical protein